MLLKPVYLDYAATTPLDPRAAECMQACLTLDGLFGNPASQHAFGQAAREVVEGARAKVAALLNAAPEEIIWTSGATEANNLALKGAAYLYQRRGKHIVTMKTEHKAVLDPCQHLEKEGYQVTYLKPTPKGLLDLDEFAAALRDDTVLVSIMHVNNETGVIQDVDAIARITSQRGILFHVDAAQSAGKISIDLSKTPIDLLSLSAHKVYGPKGVGALYLRKKPRVRVLPLIHGGGQEQGMRSGTLATHQIAGMGEAFHLAAQEMQRDTLAIKSLRDHFLSGLQYITNLRINGDVNHTVPHILSLRFEGMLADAILAKLPDIAVSTASACQGKGTEGSYVLRAMELSEDQAKSSVRFSFGRFTSQEDIDTALQAIRAVF
ncbi:aminotransferase class V-fold PLP-dependent enzyme [Aquicella lusitana]|uniref:cysteine desulfurase n=1 Tax=Aquicella lusitana TaxID=254246 RepID=A0A370GUD8_9COXI|nr:aminotransferase class V-fold PLP-dependent enzyme [Aquicella lusitana]RDI46890.1 cysteine desulfurase IscS [Aquicella lusitana]VVC73781.1 Cysteine desulfurase IscS [Aquicella lusitana]